MTRTKFCKPSLADGRDLLSLIIPKEQNGEWLPSMNLYELLQYIPDFISEMLMRSGDDDFKDESSNNTVSNQPKSGILGHFHLGMQYDINIWLSNPLCGVYPCQEEREVSHKGNSGQKVKKIFD